MGPRSDEQSALKGNGKLFSLQSRPRVKLPQTRPPLDRRAVSIKQDDEQPFLTTMEDSLFTFRIPTSSTAASMLNTFNPQKDTAATRQGNEKKSSDTENSVFVQTIKTSEAKENLSAGHIFPRRSKSTEDTNREETQGRDRLGVPSIAVPDSKHRSTSFSFGQPAVQPSLFQAPLDQSQKNRSSLAPPVPVTPRRNRKPCTERVAPDGELIPTTPECTSSTPDQTAVPPLSNFKRYAAKNRNASNKIRDTAQGELKGDDFKPGWIYAFKIFHPDDSYYVKIGWTTDLHGRKENHDKCYATYKTTIIFPDLHRSEDWHQIQHAQRVEKLIHAELTRKEMKMIKCPHHRKTGHLELFAVGEEKAVAVIRKWIGFMGQRPYEEKIVSGSIEPFQQTVSTKTGTKDESPTPKNSLIDFHPDGSSPSGSDRPPPEEIFFKQIVWSLQSKINLDEWIYTGRRDSVTPIESRIGTQEPDTPSPVASEKGQQALRTLLKR